MNNPIARVCVDVPVGLDRNFDYEVPQRLSEAAHVGCRVRVPFRGSTVGGFILERTHNRETSSALRRISAVIGSTPVLTPTILELCTWLAADLGGSLNDLLRMAVPPHHTAAENSWLSAQQPTAESDPVPVPSVPAQGKPPLSPHEVTGAEQIPAGDPASAWSLYPAGQALLRRLAQGESPQAIWQWCPGYSTGHWSDAVAQAAWATHQSGRSSTIVVPSTRDVAQVSQALHRSFPAHLIAVLTSEQAAAERMTAFLRILHGQARVVVGTRAAMFAPVQEPGLFVCWDDLNHLHRDQHAPYPHVRNVLVRRAQHEGAALLVAGISRSVHSAGLIASGQARSVHPDRDTLRAGTPRIQVTDVDYRDPAAGAARLPSMAINAVRQALSLGPVLVSVPRAGYVPAAICGRCRSKPPCHACGGGLAINQDGTIRCSQCSLPHANWRCTSCGHTDVRAVIVGQQRTAEEFARTFSPVPVISSSAADGVKTGPADRPHIVVASIGSEIPIPGGYAAAVVMDTWVLLHRTHLGSDEDALHRWLSVASLVRPAHHGGVVTVVGEGHHPAVQALIRWDPVTAAERWWHERKELHLPPAVRTVEVSGNPTTLSAIATATGNLTDVDVFGPFDTPDPDRMRLLIRAPHTQHPTVIAAIGAARTLAHQRGVKVVVDPNRFEPG